MTDRVSRDLNIEFEAPVRIESEMNKREHWAKRKKRFDRQRCDVRLSWPLDKCRDARMGRACPQCVAKALPLVVTLTRIGPRTLDTDNLASGFKAVRDQIAHMLSMDDGDKRLTWRYQQEKGKPKQYAIRVHITSDAHMEK